MGNGAGVTMDAYKVVGEKLNSFAIGSRNILANLSENWSSYKLISEFYILPFGNHYLISYGERDLEFDLHDIYTREKAKI